VENIDSTAEKLLIATPFGIALLSCFRASSLARADENDASLKLSSN